MPNRRKGPDERTDQLRFLADRFALLMTELVQRDLDYEPFAFDEFYENEQADEMRQSKHYEVSIDFVRRMLRRHNEKRAAHG